jgi:hypothetical protein
MQTVHWTALAKARVDDEKLQSNQNFNSIFRILSAGACSAMVNEWPTQALPQQSRGEIEPTLQR